MLKYILYLYLFATNSHASEIIGSIATPDNETIIFGEAAQTDGTFNKILVEQPQNTSNPFGDPVHYTASSSVHILAPQTPQPSTTENSSTPNIFTENSPQNPSVSQMSPQAVGAEIQNKLYQSGNRIYDIQSYPANDINYINQNDQNNAITNYPAY